MEEQSLYAAQEDDLPDMDDPEWEECYATYLDARRRFAKLKTNRGFYPVVALTDTNAAHGTSFQRPVPPKSKGKGSKSKSKPPPRKGDAKSRASLHHGKVMPKAVAKPPPLRWPRPEHASDVANPVTMPPSVHRGQNAVRLRRPPALRRRPKVKRQ